MSEYDKGYFKSRYRSKKEFKKARENNYREEPIDPDYFPPPVLMPLDSINQALLEILLDANFPFHEALKRSKIYQKTVFNARNIVSQNLVQPESTKVAAERELIMISYGLDQLLNGFIPLYIRNNSDTITTFEGYFDSLTGEEQRLVAYHRQQLPTQELSSPRSATHISLYSIKGRTSQGKAIAGSNGSIRCNFTYTNHPLYLPSWGVSIESGEKSDKFRRWRAINPLSQVIADFKSEKYIGRNFTEDQLYTLTYSDSSTQSPAAIEEFRRFNASFKNRLLGFVKHHPSGS